MWDVRIPWWKAADAKSRFEAYYMTLRLLAGYTALEAFNKAKSNATKLGLKP